MMKLDKIKVLTTLVVVLLLINITTIASIWQIVDFKNLSLKAHQPQGPKEFIIAKLGLDKEQQQVFEVLRKEHFEQMSSLQQNIKTEKEAMYDLLKANSPDTAQTFAHIARIMQSEELLERLTFEHFRKVRALCNDEQKQHFDVIIDRIMHMVKHAPKAHEPNDDRHMNPMQPAPLP